jgi:hypothetical protein
MITVSRPGYEGRGRNNAHHVRVGANMPELTFQLMPNATITGRVTLSTGDEADGIHVIICRQRYVNGHEQWTQSGSATTDSEGVFRMGDLDAPGTYLLYTMSSTDRVGQVSERAARYGYPSVIYPGVTDVAAAGLITIAPGQQATADFVLTRQKLYPVTIAAPQGGGGASMQIFDISGRALGFSTQWDQQAGVGRVNLPSGHYYAELHDRSPRYAPLQGRMEAYGRVEFTVADGPVSGLSMTLSPSLPVAVHIHKVFTAGSETGAQNGGEATDSSPGLNLNLTSADSFGNRGMGGNLHHPEGSSDNTLFELSNVTPGRYWVTVNPYQGYVSALTSGGADLLRDPLTIGAGNTTAPIEITLRNDAGSISGQLNFSSSTSDTAGASATEVLGEVQFTNVYAVPLFPSAQQFGQTAESRETQFTIANLVPGSYRVFAVDQYIDFASFSPEERQRYLNKGETVKVDPNGIANVQLDVIRVADMGPPE